MVWREGILLLNRRNDRHGVDLHKGVSTHSEAKYTASLWDMAKNLHLGVAKPRWGNHPTFGFAPKAEDFLPIPNHKLIRHYSLGIDSDICIPRIGGPSKRQIQSTRSAPPSSHLWQHIMVNPWSSKPIACPDCFFFRDTKQPVAKMGGDLRWLDTA
ncbi:hypothetical protein BK187_02170 [Brucella melitensis]|nr:hypothetical protein BK187_02170 [Brucella melitensis]ARY27221.1 hypothetical protein BK219_02165 [Brucella melitensis]ARY36708.1 hypothetical protein BK217_02170 [Brucella melitensis]